MSALVIGEALILQTVAGDGTISRRPGGAMLNTAISLRRLGRTARLVTDFGFDVGGDILAEYTASNGLELWLPLDTQRRNPTSVCHLTPSTADPAAPSATDLATGAASPATPAADPATPSAPGPATRTFDFTWDIQDIPASGACKLDLEVLAPRSVAFGSAACHVEPGATKVRNWVTHLRDSATILYDPNVIPELVGDLDRARETAEEFVALSDIVKASSEDIALLFGPDADFAQIADRWRSKGPSLVVITCAEEGTLLYPHDGSVVHIPPQQVEVVDTDGAGDAFFAALIDGLCRLSLDGADNRESLKRISRTHLHTLGAYATTAAAITVSREGANPPTREELAALNGKYRTV
ncbi:MAG: PfkB family carbohydrate kinase [Actinomycetaceae bacterium]|nr:PfkB family carbohydrate kinase [Actinomycetaceae bacterium]